MILFYNQQKEHVQQASAMLGMLYPNELSYEKEISGNPRIIIHSCLEDFLEVAENTQASKHLLMLEENTLTPDELSDLSHKGLRYLVNGNDVNDLVDKIGRVYHEKSNVLAVSADRELVFNTSKDNKLSLPGFDNNHYIGISAETKRLVEEGAQYTEMVKEQFGKMERLEDNNRLDMLILGENGVGKTEFVKMLADNLKIPVSVVNIGSLAPGTATAELFGNSKGAYTGADQERKGIFESNNNGIVFLDEIGNMDKSVQAYMLSLIQSRKFYRMGETGDIKKEQQFRGIIVFATNSDMDAQIAKGEFRQDLFERIDKNTVVIKPLRERKEDISVIAEAVLQEENRFVRKEKQKGITPETLKALESLPFKGNIRSLKNLIPKMMKVEKGANITLETLLKTKQNTTYKPAQNIPSEQEVLNKIAADVKAQKAVEKKASTEKVKVKTQDSTLKQETKSLVEKFSGKPMEEGQGKLELVGSENGKGNSKKLE